ncbi:hypothetical protein OSB04_024956 [Centaurea solstitialis]|uniref:CCHC-type domain-containing protein n=1 Tax=Centaurea solstitialis TaxID=347529 RepID=A0AA38SM66_9ASTR|nr:hypothetical protein OSB04_024956 [Centaurea solstitialis]
MCGDCKVAAKSCFKCFQLGHFGHECSTAAVSSQLSCSVPLKAIEAIWAKGHARVFQLMAKEVGRLGKLLEVEIADEKSVVVSDVYRGVVIELKGVKFRIDLTSIPNREIHVVIGMNWLGHNRARSDCESQKVEFRTPSGGVLSITGSGMKRFLKDSSLAKDSRYVHQGGISYFAFGTNS